MNAAQQLKEKYTAALLRQLPTLYRGHAENLKIDTGKTRVWLSRLTTEDGAPYDNRVIIERYLNGQWQIATEYEG